MIKSIVATSFVIASSTTAAQPVARADNVVRDDAAKRLIDQYFQCIASEATKQVANDLPAAAIVERAIFSCKSERSVTAEGLSQLSPPVALIVLSATEDTARAQLQGRIERIRTSSTAKAQ